MAESPLVRSVYESLPQEMAEQRYSSEQRLMMADVTNYYGRFLDEEMLAPA